MHREILQLFEPLQMHPQLRVAPAGYEARTSRRLKRKSARSIFSRSHSRLHHVFDQPQQLSGLRRQFVERPAQHFMREPVRLLDVVERDFDVRDGLASARGCSAVAADAGAAEQSS